jgi:S-formylglutathione hydrolase FrmB
MSDTKALEEVIDFYKSMNNTDEDPKVVALGSNASAELEQLRLENAEARKVIEYYAGGSHDWEIAAAFLANHPELK